MLKTILLVDDEPHVITAMKRALMDEPWEIHTASRGEEGLQILQKHKMAVVLSDEKMPGMGGADFLSTVRERYPDTIRMMLTGHASLESTVKAVNSGEVYRFFTKPWDDLQLKLALRGAVEKYNLEQENRRLLATVKRQAVELKLLEKVYPGISTLQRDRRGTIVLPEVSEEEYADILEQCNRQFG